MGTRQDNGQFHGPGEWDTAARSHILLVEDDSAIAELVKLHLADLCEELTVAHDGHHGMRLAMERDWALIVLDLRLPGPDGLAICRAVRRERPWQPVMMLSAKSTEFDRVLGLESGADDYLPKPFGVLELTARVRAILRRIGNLSKRRDAHSRCADGFVAGPFAIDPGRREVRKGGHVIDLTAREFDLLEHMARNPGRVFSRPELLDTVWGYGYEGYEHTVNSHINRLRAKIEQDPPRPEVIVTVWGVGYKFADFG